MLEARDFPLDIPGTSTRTVPLWRAKRGGQIEWATWVQENAVDGTKNVKLRNLTTSTDITSALTIDGLGALGSAVFALVSGAAAQYKAGDVIGLVYTVSVAGTVAPGACSVAAGTRFGRTGEIGDSL